MAALAFVVTALAFASTFSPSVSTHFRAFTMNFHAVGNQENGIAGEMQFNFRISWRRSSSEGGCTDAAIQDQRLLGSPVRFSCLSNNCGSQFLDATMEYVCTSFSAANDWASGTRTFEVSFPVADSQEYVIGNDFDGTYDCCWIDTQNAFGEDIRFQLRISFVPRNDSMGVVNRGKINQSPVVDMVPLLPARAGCKLRLTVPHADPDFDDVKCRWALPNADDAKDECGSACIDSNKPSGLFNATLLEEDCEIIWIPTAPGLYAAALQIEDFYSNDVARSNPLGSVPLQWLMDVVDTGTPCSSKPIFPHQVHIPRQQPRCFAVESGGNLTLEILIEHSNFPSNEIDDAVYILPRGMSVTDLMERGNGVKSVAFTWQPDAEQANRPHIMCFQFLDDARAPSNLVCFTVVTSVSQPKPMLNTQAVNGSVAVEAVASISFNHEVQNPTVSPRFISVYHVNDGTLIQRVDSSNRSLVTIGADSRTVSFRLDSSQPNTYQQGEEYQIVFEEGVVVGINASCSGGGPVAKGIEAGEWTFISSGQPGDDCHAGTHNCNDRAQCVKLLPNGFRCECMIGYRADGSGAPANQPVCIDCNECLGECPESIVDKGACHVNVDCTNVPGSFNCTCKTGYVPQVGSSVDRPVCIKIDECVEKRFF